MDWKKIVGAVVFTALLFAAFGEPAQAFDEAVDGPTTRPISGTVVRDFDPPAADWLPGHRGVDLSGASGDPVVAAVGGKVVFAGPLAGRSVISVELPSGARTTYEPVIPAVRVGEHVSAGELIGQLAPGHCPERDHVCLHFGLKRGDAYLDPRVLLAHAGAQSPRIRLLPATAADDVAQRASTRQTASKGTSLGTAGSRPADGPITSRFGTRRHPITGVVKLHDGLDIGAACGSAIRANRPGTVVQTQLHPAYGWWLIIDHHDGLRTGYAHAQRWTVRPGQVVGSGQLLGTVGSTGYSTGCHLHFMAWQDGSITDPHPLLAEH